MSGLQRRLVDRIDRLLDRLAQAAEFKRPDMLLFLQGDAGHEGSVAKHVDEADEGISAFGIGAARDQLPATPPALLFRLDRQIFLSDLVHWFFLDQQHHLLKPIRPFRNRRWM